MTDEPDCCEHYGNSIRHYRISESPPPTHHLIAPVAALKIASTCTLQDGYCFALDRGEIAVVYVPADFCVPTAPAPGDMLIIGPNGVITHRPAALFEAEARPIDAPVMPGCDGPEFQPGSTARIVRQSGETTDIPLMDFAHLT